MQIDGYFNAQGEPVIRLDLGTASTDVLVDTGFDGGLTLPSYVANQLDLTYVGLEGFTSAFEETIVAKTYSIEIDWLGKRVRVSVIVNPRINQALLGSHMLKDRRLVIDYGERTVTIIAS